MGIVASRDQNFVTAKLAVLNTDIVQGRNLVRIKINPATERIKVNTTDTISFTMRPVDPKDDNFVNCWLFRGKNGLTYPAVANSSGEILVDF